MVFIARGGGWRSHAFLPSLSAHTMDHLACITGVSMPYWSRVEEDGKQVDNACERHHATLPTCMCQQYFSHSIAFSGKAWVLSHYS